MGAIMGWSSKPDTSRTIAAGSGGIARSASVNGPGSVQMLCVR
jgi:hypothetical protein